MPILLGLVRASTAEALMRSRYTAYVLGNVPYLLDSWHGSTRPAGIDIEPEKTQWQGLTIVNTEAGLSADSTGKVEFIARYQQDGKPGMLHERSHFVCEQDQWFYVDGEMKESLKTGRNEPCFCGSGKKYKRCCANK